MKPIEALNQLGQSLWYDNIQRSLLENGQLAQLISDGEIRGVTSNPSIFNNAIANSHDYDAALTSMAWSGWNTDQIFYQLAVEDIQAAADLFLHLYQETDGADGYVSLEVSPYLANDTQNTLREAQRLWSMVDRPNLMIKIPATKEGIPAIREAIAAGINVNVTLIFSLDRYAQVMDAYLTGLERRVAAGLPIHSIASVASFFVSRVDTNVDAQLRAIKDQGGPAALKASELLGKAAIANARLAYAQFKTVFNTDRFANLKAKGARVQRPLWASTSTKNPSYRDVMYVEELIGPQTINTLPPQTLMAFREHGIAQLSLEKDVDLAQAQLGELEELGISMSQVTAQLEIEGVKTFADAFTALLKTIEKRRAEAQQALGSLSQSVVTRVDQLEKARFPQRLHQHDASLWSSDPDEQAEIVKRMGWLEAPSISRSLVQEIDSLARELAGEGYQKALLLGMGGSSLAPEVLRGICGVGEIGGAPGLDLRILDSTDPGQVKESEAWVAPGKTVFIVSSKSGTTSEVNAFFNYFWDKAQLTGGIDAGRHFIAITDPGTALEKIGLECGFRKVFLADPSVGGRNSALTAFGLVPAGLMGLDVNLLLERGAWMANQCAANVPAGRNPGLVLGAIMGQAALEGRDKVTILADPMWQPFGAWMEQLIAESSGKKGKGILPVDGEPLQTPAWYSNDRLFVYMRSTGELSSLIAGLQDLGHPVLTIEFTQCGDLAAGFYLWEIATAVACSVIGVNSFDQPDVQDNKNRTTAKIQQFKASGRFEDLPPSWRKDSTEVYGAVNQEMAVAGTLSELVELFLKQAGEGDFIAINAYLPRNDANLAKLQKLRVKIQELTGKPTTLGFGPRFLHSTGQLHKGGANNGLFIQITTDASDDMVIPGEGFSFGTLERAQALGDLEALLARSRRAIRIHLISGDIDQLY